MIYSGMYISTIVLRTTYLWFPMLLSMTIVQTLPTKVHNWTVLMPYGCIDRFVIETHTDTPFSNRKLNHPTHFVFWGGLHPSPPYRVGQPGLSCFSVSFQLERERKTDSVTRTREPDPVLVTSLETCA